MSDDDKTAIRVLGRELGEALLENDRLQKQVNELQGSMTKMVLAQPHRRVRDFFRVVGQRVAEKPAAPTADELALGLRLVVEEVFELLAACDVRAEANEALAVVLALIEEKRLNDPLSACVFLDQVADALADIDYVVEGMRVRCGVYGPPIADLVHVANMTKAGGPLDAHGKRLKPPGFKPPDVAGELKRQGWDGR